MSNESDDSKQTSELEVIRELLGKLEAVAAKEDTDAAATVSPTDATSRSGPSVAPRGLPSEDASSAPVSESRANDSGDRIGDTNPAEPRLDLATLKRSNAIAPLSPNANQLTVTTPVADATAGVTSKRSQSAVAATSFVLGAAAAIGLVYMIQPDRQGWLLPFAQAPAQVGSTRAQPAGEVASVAPSDAMAGGTLQARQRASSVLSAASPAEREFEQKLASGPAAVSIAREQSATPRRTASSDPQHPAGSAPGPAAVIAEGLAEGLSSDAVSDPVVGAAKPSGSEHSDDTSAAAISVEREPSAVSWPPPSPKPQAEIGHARAETSIPPGEISVDTGDQPSHRVQSDASPPSATDATPEAATWQIVDPPAPAADDPAETADTQTVSPEPPSRNVLSPPQQDTAGSTAKDEPRNALAEATGDANVATGSIEMARVPTRQPERRPGPSDTQLQGPSIAAAGPPEARLQVSAAEQTELTDERNEAAPPKADPATTGLSSEVGESLPSADGSTRRDGSALAPDEDPAGRSAAPAALTTPEPPAQRASPTVTGTAKAPASPVEVANAPPSTDATTSDAGARKGAADADDAGVDVAVANAAPPPPPLPSAAATNPNDGTADAHTGGGSHDLAALQPAQPKPSPGNDAEASRQDAIGPSTIGPSTIGPSTIGPSTQGPSPPAGPKASRLRLDVPPRVLIGAYTGSNFPLRLEPLPTVDEKLLIVIRGVPDWLELSKGRILGGGIWLLPAHMAEGVMIGSPKQQTGSADLLIELARADGHLLAKAATTVEVDLSSIVVPPRPRPIDFGQWTNPQ